MENIKDIHVQIRPSHPTNRWWRSKTLKFRLSKEITNFVSTNLLVVSVSHPGESTERTNHHGDVGDHPHDKDGVVGDIEIPEIVDHLEKQPYYS